MCSKHSVDLAEILTEIMKMFWDVGEFNDCVSKLIKEQMEDKNFHKTLTPIYDKLLKFLNKVYSTLVETDNEEFRRNFVENMKAKLTIPAPWWRKSWPDNPDSQTFRR